MKKLITITTMLFMALFAHSNNLVLPGDLIVESGGEVVINSGNTITILNGKTLTIRDGGKINNNGTIQIEGTMIIEGDIPLATAVPGVTGAKIIVAAGATVTGLSEGTYNWDGTAWLAEVPVALTNYRSEKNDLTAVYINDLIHINNTTSSVIENVKVFDLNGNVLFNQNYNIKGNLEVPFSTYYKTVLIRIETAKIVKTFKVLVR